MAANNNFQPELLAPAGSEECVYAAVENGADAVYFGLSETDIAGTNIIGIGNFNARSRATNIPLDKLGSTMNYLHRHGVRGYVTLNTLIRSDELPVVERLLREIVTNRCDAVIVQDLGVARLARQFCPDLTLHASTQMSLTSQRSMELAQTLGIRRIVLPRELSLKQIRKLCSKTTMELECFIHGALCISFSGQCYASLGLGGLNTNRSANRGCCAQPCRLPYSLLDGSSGKILEQKLGKPNSLEFEPEFSGQQFLESKQFLSPCDLAVLPILPQLLATGVNALKIEGRLKPPEYVAEVTRIYRGALDTLLETKNEKPENVAVSENKKKTFDDKTDLTTLSQQQFSESAAEAVNRLELAFSRGFSTGWLEGIDPYRLVPGNIVSHRGSVLGTVVEMRRDAAVVDLLAPVRCGDGVRFENETFPEHSQGGRVYEIIYRRQSVPEAQAGSRVLLTFANHSLDASYILQGQTVQKTDDPQQQRKIRKNLEAHKLHRRIPLQLSVRAVTGEPIIVNVQNPLGTTYRLTGTANLETARKHPLSVDLLREQFGRLGETVYVLDKVDAVIEGDPMVPLSVLGQLRREMIEKLNTYQPNDPNPVFFDNVLESLRNENKRFSEQLSSESQTVSPTVHFLLRRIQMFENDSADSVLRQILESGCRSFYAELRDMEEYKIAAKMIRQIKGEFVAVLPRILKAGESGILKKLADIEPDAVLARNFEEIVFFREQKIPVIADFSLNLINDLSFYQVLEWGVERITPGWDLDQKQIEELCRYVPAEKMERIIFGRLPLFTMEHCLWRTNLVKPNEPCHRLCRTQPLQLRDRRGAVHTVRSDLLCRNIIESAELIDFRKNVINARHLRIEWDNSLTDSVSVSTFCRNIF
ncbi:MAG: U32 family peptidase [Planctomycetaceae bacterium]|jgi:putative protease|nr:U32 family peptidase [Planctomycetaceae bacterium]